MWKIKNRRSQNSNSETSATLKKSRELLEKNIGPRLGIEPMDYEKWYDVTTAQILRFGGVKLLAKYNYSHLALLRAVFPEYSWSPIRLPKLSRSTTSVWDDRKNIISFLGHIGETVGIAETDYNAWYKVSGLDIRNLGGYWLLKKFDFKIANLIPYAFPEHKWLPENFVWKPLNYWLSIENQRELILRIGLKLGIGTEDLSAWYNVSLNQLLENGGESLLPYLHDNSRYKLLRTVFPDHIWHPWLFKTSKRTIKSLNPHEIREFSEYANGVLMSDTFNNTSVPK
jgi:hypothetical protein